MSRRFLVLLLTTLACSDPIAVRDGSLTVTRVPGMLELRNASDAPIHYFIVEREAAALVDWFPCAGPSCRAVPPRDIVLVPDAEIIGFSPEAREALVSWWRSVPDGRGGFEHDLIRALVIPL